MAKRRPSGDGMVRKRDDGRWEGRIVVGHKDNGDPIFHYVYAPTQKELTAKLHQSIEIYDGAELTEGSKMTLSEWLDRWLEEYAAPTVRPSTLNGYHKNVRYIKPCLGDKPIGQITTADVQKMYNHLKREGRIKEHPEYGHQLADSTIVHIHSMLHEAMDAAVREHLVVRNPTEGVTVPKATAKPKQILNDEQLDAFMRAIEQDEVWHDFFYTEMTTGLRRGEICGLRWSDFDEEAGALKVSRTIHCEPGGRLVAGETKTGKGTRRIVLPSTTAALLRERKKTTYSEWIFPDPLKPESPTNPSSAYFHMKTILKKAGLPSIRFHDGCVIIALNQQSLVPQGVSLI